MQPVHNRLVRSSLPAARWLDVEIKDGLFMLVLTSDPQSVAHGGSRAERAPYNTTAMELEQRSANPGPRRIFEWSAWPCQLTKISTNFLNCQ